MPWLRDAYRGAVGTWKNDLFRVTVRPFVAVGIFLTGIDAIRSVYHHDLSRIAIWAILWVFLGPFLYFWWQRNKA